jgi:hypothetical protein
LAAVLFWKGRAEVGVEVRRMETMPVLNFIFESMGKDVRVKRVGLEFWYESVN